MIVYAKQIVNMLDILKDNFETLKRDSNTSSQIMQACKSLFDLLMQLCDANHFGLTELYIDGLDKEQVWQQIELVNNNWYKVIDEAKKTERSKSRTVEEVPTLDKKYEQTDEGCEEISDDERVKQILKKVRFVDDIQDETNEVLSDDEICDDEDEEVDSDEENVDGGEENREDENSEDEFERKAKKPRLQLEPNGYEDPLEIFKKSIRNSKKSENEGDGMHKDKVNDSKFFNISEMNAFLDKQDAIEGKERNFDDSEDDDEEGYDEDAPIRYDDFFDQPEGIEVENNTDNSRSTGMDGKDKTHLSSFERRLEMMRKKASQLEDKAVAEKEWQMKGEVTHLDRPINSLVDKEVEFGVAKQPTLITTPEVMKKIEEILCQRAMSQVWDGPKRKIKIKEAAFSLNKKVVLDQEKSKLSLAEIYENEYLDQMREKDDKVPEEVEEIQSSMTALFRKLDALSNFHFNPKPAVPDVKIVSNVAAMTMEEVAPVAMTEAMSLAPEEIMANGRKGLLGESERSETDKKRANRLRKKKQHFIKLVQEDREKIKKLKAEKKMMHKSGTDDHLDNREIKKKPKKSGKKKAKHT